MVVLKRRQLELQSVEFVQIIFNNFVRACMSVTIAGRLQIYIIYIIYNKREIIGVFRICSPNEMNKFMHALRARSGELPNPIAGGSYSY